MLGFASLGELALGEVPLLSNLSGVAATGAAGSLVANPGVVIAGVAATGAANGLGSSEVDKALTGVAATGAAGTAAAEVDATALAGVAASGIAGIIVVTSLLLGVAGTGEANALGWPEVDAAAIAGVAATGVAGAVVGDLPLNVVVGVAGSGAVGACVAQVAPAATFGVAATGAAGAITANPQAFLNGVAAIGSAGTLLFPGQLLLPSVFATGAAGVVSKTGTVTLAGVFGTGAVGAAIARVSPAALGGVAATGAAGVFVNWLIQPTLVGVAGTGLAEDIFVFINTPAGMAGFSDFTPRDGAAYAEALAALLPTGPAWPRDPDRALMKTVSGLAQIWGDPVDSRAATLLQVESDPRATLEMLPDWERNFGLPDTCTTEPLSIGDRQTALVTKMTLRGGQSRAFFIQLAFNLGYHIRIVEHSPFMCGVSRCGDTTPDGFELGEPFRWELGPPTIRFYWTVYVLGLRVTWFRCGNGGGQCGVDPMARIALATDLQCMFERYKPAHTAIVFNYSQAAPE